MSFINSDLYKKSRFLITGGAGFIGSHLARHLLENGAKNVRVLDDLSTGFKENIQSFQINPDFEFLEGDIRNMEVCQEAVKDVDVVLHQAALGSVPRSIKDPITSHDVNVNGFLNMIHSSMEAGIKSFVYASSSSVYGDHPGLPKFENQIGNPLSPYALTKVMNERYAEIYNRVYNFPSVGLRYFNVFGPNQSPEGQYAAVIPLFIKALQSNISPVIFGDGEQTRDFTFIENTIEANIRSAFSDLDGNLVFNVACGESFSVNQLYNTLKIMAGSDLPPQYAPPRAGDIKDSLADISFIKSKIGYFGSFNFQEGLKKTWEFNLQTEKG